MFDLAVEVPPEHENRIFVIYIFAFNIDTSLDIFIIMALVFAFLSILITNSMTDIQTHKVIEHAMPAPSNVKKF